MAITGIIEPPSRAGAILGEWSDRIPEIVAKRIAAQQKQQELAETQRYHTGELSELDARKVLYKAQAEQALAEARQKKMIENLLSGATGGYGSTSSANIPSSGTPSVTMPPMGGNLPGNAGTALTAQPFNMPVSQPQPRPQSGMDANKALLLSGLLKLPTQVVEGNLHTAFGTYPVGETPAQKRLGAATQQATGQTLKDIAAGTEAGAGLKGSFDYMDDIFNNPHYKNVAGTWEGKFINTQPFGLPIGAQLQKRFPNKFSKEDADIAGEASATLGNIVVQVGQKFKGPFKNMTNTLINTMKPNMGDSLQTQKGKVKALQVISEYGDKINEIIEKNINSGMSPVAAMKDAMNKVSFREIKDAAHKAMNKSSKNNMITIIDSTGQEHSILENNLDIAKQRDPGLRVK